MSWIWFFKMILNKDDAERFTTHIFDILNSDNFSFWYPFFFCSLDYVWVSLFHCAQCLSSSSSSLSYKAAKSRSSQCRFISFISIQSYNTMPLVHWLCEIINNLVKISFWWHIISCTVQCSTLITLKPKKICCWD